MIKKKYNPRDSIKCKCIHLKLFSFFIFSLCNISLDLHETVWPVALKVTLGHSNRPFGNLAALKPFKMYYHNSIGYSPIRSHL